ncbi:MAG: tautomerase family protein [Ramlibacter sp.]
MPTLILKVAPLQNPERYQALAQGLTRLTAQILGKRSAVTAVLIEDLPRGRWHIGGTPVERPTAFLEISVTQGTNTAEEKARFVQEAHAELRRQLAAGGELEEASYVIVRELAAGDWGYDGQTQRARQLARETAPA